MLSNLALHTAARHYCQAQSNYWQQHSTELKQTQPRDPTRYQQMLLESYARANVLTIICTEIKRLDPDKLDDTETTRDRILQVGRVAQEHPLSPNMGQISTPQVVRLTFGINVEDAIANEREAFCQYIKELSDSQLKAIQPLPYERVLSPAESKTVWQQVRSRWHIIGPYWYPLSQCKMLDIAAFDTEVFEAFCSSFSLIDLLSSHGINRVWELSDYGNEYELDLSLVDPAFNGNENYWTSESLDWIIYASHESSMTIGGWLLESIKAQWPDWEKHTW